MKNPNLEIRNQDIIADLHAHTVASGHAYSTIEEYSIQAKKVGLKYIAMTDHGPAMPGGPHLYHFYNMKMVPDKLNGVNIIRGCEANIIDENGKLDIPDDALDILDFVLFTFHPKCGYEDQGEKKNTQVMIKAMDNRYVNAIAHLENLKFPVDYETVIKEAVKRDILIEANNSSYISRPGTTELTVNILKLAKKNNAKICLGTDSHISTMIGDFNYALKLCKEAGVGKEDIVNTSEKSMREYIFNRRKSVV